MKLSIVILALTMTLLCSEVHAGSCTNCTAYYDCMNAAEYCCNNKCVEYPKLGEACPCKTCAGNLPCVNGVCIFNGLNCPCSNTTECDSVGWAERSRPECVDNTCQRVSVDNPPFNYFTPGGPCGAQCETNYCNPSTNLCDYNPVGTTCRSTYFCDPANVCVGTCQPRKSAGEQCVDDFQCPSDFICRKTSSSSPTVCARRAEAGEYCTDLNSCNRMNCTSNVCTYPARGDACFDSRVCGPNDICHLANNSLTCVAKNSVADGEYCYSANECQSSICSGRCLPMSTLGGFCNVTQQCPNGQCLDNKCYGIAFSGEKCNSTYTCFNADRPCKNGICPQYYSAVGEACSTDNDCAIGRCSNNVCDAPMTCQTVTDCGRNMICDCGQCAPFSYPLYIGSQMYNSESQQLLRRSPERDCIKNVAVNGQCESVLAKYYCLSNCLNAFPNGVPIPHKIDCATLKVIALNVTKQPCCSATAQTDCADTLLNCNVFNENNIKPFITRPSIPTAPYSAPTAPSTAPTAPNATPSAPSTAPTAPSATPTAPAGTPTASNVPSSGNTPQATPSASVPQAAPTSTPQSPAVPSSVPNAPLATPSNSDTCNCAAPTPLCDQELSACVGLRVTPVVQCVEYANNQYTAYMTYISAESINVTLSDNINFLNVSVQSKVNQFAPGRPFTYPQSAFTVIAASAQQVLWYLDGFKLTFDIAAEELRCPQDVTFQMTSSATVAQLLAISDSLIGNLSDVMQIERSRLNVTFSASTKRQTTSSVITVVVKADQNSTDSSSQVVLDFVQTGFTTFISRVPTAAVASVTTVPPANEQSGSKTVTPPANPVALNTPRDRSVVSSGAIVITNIALLIIVSFVV